MDPTNNKQMKKDNTIRKMEFTPVMTDGALKFKAEVIVKEGFAKRFLALFKEERTVTTWVTESQAASMSNYLYNEIKRSKKAADLKSDGVEKPKNRYPKKTAQNQ
jgi:hypothetical protein